MTADVQAPDSPLLSRPGAVPAAGGDASVAAHYGNPFAEQRQVASAAALVDRSSRGVVTVTGPDRLSWLHSLTSQHLSALPPMRATEALVLSPHGHVEHHLHLHDDGATTWIDVEPGTAPALVAYLNSMRFLLRVDVADVTDRWAVLSVLGPAAAETVRALAGSVPPTGTDDDAGSGPVLPLPASGFARGAGPEEVVLLLERGTVGSLPERLGLPLAGLDAYEAMRVERRRPRLKFETDHRTIPHEVGWLQTAVHLDKGCYRGQETVARVHNLGRPPRRLVLLQLDGSTHTLPATGDAVESAGTRVGIVTTAVRHYLQGPLALALVKRNTPDDAALTAGGVAATIDPGDGVDPEDGIDVGNSAVTGPGRGSRARR